MKITTKQLRSFIASERAGLDGIGFNDAWNVQKYGMDRATAAKIRRAVSDEYGTCKPTVFDLARINKRLQYV